MREKKGWGERQKPASSEEQWAENKKREGGRGQLAWWEEEDQEWTELIS